MNKRVMHSILLLLWVFLAIFSIAKIFIPEYLVAQVSKPNILSLGDYIEGDTILRLFCDTAVGMLTFHFYLCACCQKWCLNFKHYIILLAYSLFLAVGYLYFPTIAMVLDLASLISFPTMLYAKIKQFILIFVLHQIGQILLLYIRSEALFLAGENYAVQFVLVFDVYVWLAIYYLYSNMYKEETLWDFLVSRSFTICRRLSWKKNSKK